VKEDINRIAQPMLLVDDCAQQQAQAHAELGATISHTRQAKPSQFIAGCATA